MPCNSQARPRPAPPHALRRRARPFLLILWGAAALALPADRAMAAPSCPIEVPALEAAKPNKLYLYFPASDDASFPSYGAQVSPAKAFNVSDFSSYTGTAADLRDRITDVVTDDYCELDVQVIQTTGAPPTTFPRRTTVAIGSDANTTGGFTWGQAQEVDTGDATLIDFARVWAGTYQASAGGAGGALSGANSTTERWAFSIGGTAAHEAGHTYGLSHADGETVKPGEDSLHHHIMPRGALLTNEDRAGSRRHFDDTSFGILAANVGLSIETLHNWDFTNPNDVDAKQLQMEVLSTHPTLILSSFWNGPRSPWINPVVSGPVGTTVFKGSTYNRFQLTWSTGKVWSNGPSGTVPPAERFHIGASFSGVDINQPDPIIITKVSLLDAGGTPLTLSPRMFGYDAGTLDSADGSFNLHFFNLDDPGHPLLLKDLTVSELPRVLSLDAMVTGARLETWQKLPILPWRTVRPLARGESELGAPVKDVRAVTIARLSQGRHVFQRYDESDCQAGARPGDSTREPDVARCLPGFRLDLFPATTVFVTATVVDPSAKHWDSVQSRFVVGPVESKLFYQFGGIHPDLNHNGVDDAIDIANGTSRDVNGNGVPDEAEPGASPAPGAGWELSPFIGLFQLDDKLPINDGAVVGFRAGRRLSGRLGLEAEIGVTSADDRARSSGAILQFGANLLYHFAAPGGAVRPFALAGVGGLVYRGFARDAQSFAVNLGVGLKARLSGIAGLRLDVRDFFATSAFGLGSTQNWQATGGLVFALP